MSFDPTVLDLDCEAEANRICNSIRGQTRDLRRRGAVLGLSGGIDSSTVAGLCAKALGPERVVGLQMCERDSSDDTLRLSQSVADEFGIRVELEDISDILTAFGCYARRDEAIASVVSGYGDGYKSKIVLPSALGEAAYNIYSVVVEAPDGTVTSTRMTPDAYLGVVAAVNFKQRTRKTLEYYWADRLNYLVAGTPNRLEYDQGFFVKNGDGAADIKPIAHLYKTQVYQMAHYLGVPAEICRRAPTTDTYTLEQGQDEFYFSLPYDKMDLCLYAKDHGVAPEEVAPVVGITTAQVLRVFADIDRKRTTTQYLHARPQLVDQVQTVEP